MEVGEVLVVGPNYKRLLSKCKNHCQQFTVFHIIVAFCRGKMLGKEGIWVQLVALR